MESDCKSQRAPMFRLGLPEWLSQQVDSGRHKGVSWVDQEQRIFKVPWKHASRNGWESKDVSLFKAWAIYTGRFREGVDEPRPALWKTNFRCAVNSHGSLVFLPEYGLKTGDRAHRVIKIVNGLGKKSRRTVGIQAEEHEITKTFSAKQVGSGFSMPSGDSFKPVKFSSELRLSPSAMLFECTKPSVANSAPSMKESNCISAEFCPLCCQLKSNYRVAVDRAFATVESSSSDNYMIVRNRYLEMLASDHHICEQDHPVDSLMKSFLGDENKSGILVSPKRDVQFLYHVGKEFQNARNRCSNLENTYDCIDSKKEIMLGLQRLSNVGNEAESACIDFLATNGRSFASFLSNRSHSSHNVEDVGGPGSNVPKFEKEKLSVETSDIDNNNDDRNDNDVYDDDDDDDHDDDDDDDILIVPRQ